MPVDDIVLLTTSTILGSPEPSMPTCFSQRRAMTREPRVDVVVTESDHRSNRGGFPAGRQGLRRSAGAGLPAANTLPTRP
jgi:hypothetical protein